MRRVFLSLIALVVAAVSVLAGAVHFQQVAINNLVANQTLAAQEDAEHDMQIQALTGAIVDLNQHVDYLAQALVDMDNDLDFVKMQGDIIMASKRSGRNGHKVIDAWLEVRGQE
jgi:hypothetical protein